MSLLRRSFLIGSKSGRKQMIDKIVALIQGAEIENDGEITLGRTLSFLLRSEFEGVVVCQEQLYLYNAGVWQMVGRSK